jgi:hypothetical protein
MLHMFRATVSEAVTADSTITVTLNTGETVILAAADAGTTLSGTYTVADTATDVSDLTVSSYTSSVTDAAGNSMTDTTLPSGSNLGDSSSIVVDVTAPTNTFSSSSYDATSNIITLTDDAAATLEATTDFDALDTDDTLVISAGFSGDSIGNTATTDGFETSHGVTVVFDLTTGHYGSTDGSREFKADTTYEIYVKVHDETVDLSGSAAFQGGENLGVDDRVTLVGEGSGVVGPGASAVTRSGQNSRLLLWSTPPSYAAHPAAALHMSGAVIRVGEGTFPQASVWSGRCAFTGEDAVQHDYQLSLPASVGWTGSSFA